MRKFHCALNEKMSKAENFSKLRLQKGWIMHCDNLWRSPLFPPELKGCSVFIYLEVIHGGCKRGTTGWRCAQLGPFASIRIHPKWLDSETNFPQALYWSATALGSRPQPQYNMMSIANTPQYQEYHTLSPEPFHCANQGQWPSRWSYSKEQNQKEKSALWRERCIGSKQHKSDERKLEVWNIPLCCDSMHPPTLSSQWLGLEKDWLWGEQLLDHLCLTQELWLYTSTQRQMRLADMKKRKTLTSQSNNKQAYAIGCWFDSCWSGEWQMGGSDQNEYLMAWLGCKGYLISMQLCVS